MKLFSWIAFLLPLSLFSASPAFESYFNNQIVQYSHYSKGVAFEFSNEKKLQEFFEHYRKDPRLISQEKWLHTKKYHRVFIPLNNAVDARIFSQEIEDAGLGKALPVYTIDNQYTLVASPLFIARFEAATAMKEIARINEFHGVSIVKRLKYLKNGYLMRVDLGDDCSAVLKDYGQEKAVIYLHPQFLGRVQLAFVPNDFYYDQLWHLNDLASEFKYEYIYDAVEYHKMTVKSIEGAGIKAEKAWNITRGNDSIIIAVIDTGIDLNHEDLAGKFVSGYDFYDNDPDPSPGLSMYDAHGTVTSGLAAAAGNNSIGITGVCMNCLIMPIRAFSGEGSELTEEDMANTITWAADQGASIINNSWTLTDVDGKVLPAPIIIEAVKYANIQGRDGKGAVVVFASGNGNPTTLKGLENKPDTLCNDPNLICVGASNGDNQKASYSNFGIGLDVLAPSGDVDISNASGKFLKAQIFTTDISGDLGFNTNGNMDLYELSKITMIEMDLLGNYTHYIWGTSAAAPVVAGLAGLILSVNPDLTAAEVQWIIKNTTDKIDPEKARYDESGFSLTHGYGKINAFKALKMATGCDSALGEVCYTKVFGEECAADWECEQAKCQMQASKGYCSSPCQDTPCPEGYACTEKAAGTNDMVCTQVCMQDSECGEGYSCQENNGTKTCQKQVEDPLSLEEPAQNQGCSQLGGNPLTLVFILLIGIGLIFMVRRNKAVI